MDKEFKMFPCNIENLILDKERNKKEIEQFYTFELFQYKNLKKLRPCSSFLTMYKIIGKHRYSSKEILDELEKRFKEYVYATKAEQRKQNQPVKIPKPIKVKEPVVVIPKPKVITTRERVYDLFRSNMSLTSRQVSEILNVNIKTVGYYLGILRSRERRKIERELAEQEAKKENEFLLQFVCGIPLEQRSQMKLYLYSILTNW